MGAPEPTPRAKSFGSVIGIGAVTAVVSAAFLALPIVIPLGNLAKYLIVLSVLGVLLGLNFVLHGIVDWWRGKA